MEQFLYSYFSLFSGVGFVPICVLVLIQLIVSSGVLSFLSRRLHLTQRVEPLAADE